MVVKLTLLVGRGCEEVGSSNLSFECWSRIRKGSTFRLSSPNQFIFASHDNSWIRRKELANLIIILFIGVVNSYFQVGSYSGDCCECFEYHCPSNDCLCGLSRLRDESLYSRKFCIWWSFPSTFLSRFNSFHWHHCTRMSPRSVCHRCRQVQVCWSTDA